MIKIWDEKPIIELAKQGKSASQIIEALGLGIGVRQVQRIVRAAGLGRRYCRHCGGQL